MRNIKIPEWTEVLPDTANLGTKDVVCEIFGYRHATSVSALIKKGLIPKEDFREVFRRGKTHKLFWNIGKLRNLERKQ